MSQNHLEMLSGALSEQSQKRRDADVKFFTTNPPKIEFQANDEGDITTYGVFDIDGTIFYAQKYSNGYHTANLVRVEQDLIDAINQVIGMRAQ